MLFTYLGRRFRACHKGCADAFKSDRQNGLIYGPFKRLTGGFYLNAEQASLEQGFCVYCSADVRSRKASRLEKADV